MAPDIDLNTAAPTSKMKKNPQACFMGLPAELRVRIYGFVFSGLWMKEEKQTSARDQIMVAKEQKEAQTQSEMGLEDEDGEGAANVDTKPEETKARIHCCNCLNRMQTGQGSYTVPTTCTCCFGRLNPAILSTTRLIYEEALPVFYGSIEARFSMPEYWSLWKPDDYVDWTLARLPQKRLPMISQMVYTQKPGIFQNDRRYPTSIDFFLLWRAVETRLPGIKQVRVHLDLDKAFYVRKHMFRDLARATRLPKLNTMEIELSCTRFRGPLGASGEHKDSDEDKKTIANLQEDFVTSIKSEADRRGKKIEVKVSQGRLADFGCDERTT